VLVTSLAVPNLIGLVFLSGVMAKEIKEYFSNPELLG
jgi:AGCS family alanine or glycine:cation symporter